MRKVLLLLFAVLCSVCTWGQSVVMQGMACTESNNFNHAKTMLINDGLVVNQKQTTSNCIVLTNGSSSTYDVVIVKLYRKPKTQKVEKVVFQFHPNGKISKSLGYDLRKWGYSYDGPSDPEFRELYSNKYLGCGLNVNLKGWLEATFLRYDQ